MGFWTQYIASVASSLVSSTVFGVPLPLTIPFGYDQNYHQRLRTSAANTFAVRDGDAEFDFGVEFINEQDSNGQGSANGNETQHEDRHSRKAMDRDLDESLDSTVSKSKPTITWDDVAGLQNAKLELQMAVELPEKQPQLFQGKANRSILLYGPPGTGKGHLAKALAASVKSTLYTVSASDLLSKWLGESERLVRLLFQRARSTKPSIIFFDEIDASCGKRDGGSAEHDNRIKNEFLVQMDGIDKDNSGIFLLAATNLPWALDTAFIRRFQKKIEVPLPDSPTRKRIFQLQIGNSQCALSEEDCEELAERTEGYSGSDIKALVLDALDAPKTRSMQSTHFREVSNHWYLACRSNEDGAMSMNWRDVPTGHMWAFPATREDFFNALQKVKPSVDPESLSKYSEWTERYGMAGASG